MYIYVYMHVYMYICACAFYGLSIYLINELYTSDMEMIILFSYYLNENKKLKWKEDPFSSFIFSGFLSFIATSKH